MNILITTTSFPDQSNNDIGGKFVLNEAKAYTANGSSVKVLTPHQPEAKKKELIQERLEVIRFRYFFPENLQCLKTPNKPMYGQKTILSFLQIPFFLLVFIIQIIKYHQWADLIHCQWTITALLAIPCKLLFKKKIIMTVRGSDIRLLPKWLNKFIHKNVDAVIDCYGDQIWNIENKQNFSANYIKLPLIVDHDSSVSVEMPMDMRSALRKNDEVFIIIYLGRFDKVKIDDGLPIFNLIEAAKKIKEDYNAKFHVFYIGDGNKSINLKMRKLVTDNQLDNYITFLGPKNNVNDYISFCDLGIGGIAFNAVSQEFSSFKKAQLLFEGPLNQNTPWENKINTLFVKVEDVEDLAKVIVYAIMNRSHLKKIGDCAYRMMTKYIKGLNTGGAAYLKAFSKVINKGSF